MLKLLMRQFNKEMTKRILVYTGFVSLILFYPITNTVLKNDSFRAIGNWSSFAFLLCLIIYFIFPTVLLVFSESLIHRRGTHYDLYFRYLIFLIGAVILWTQFVEYHLNSVIKGTGIFDNTLRYYSLLIFGLLFILGAFKIRKYLSTFLIYVSPLFLIAVGLIFFQTANERNFNIDVQHDQSFVISEMKKSVYLLIFDGISLNSILENGQIKESLFPNMSYISKEWTWYRNATTNATSTLPACSMIFSGRYWGSKINAITGSRGNLFEELKPFVKTYNYLPFSSSGSDEKESSGKLIGSFQRAITLNKAIFVSYLEVSLPSPLRKYINSTPLKYWRFDWRGEVPSIYRSKEYLYHGETFKRHFFNFLEASTDSLKAQDSFYVLWSMISHFPYIFNEMGDIYDSNYHSFEVNMNGETALRTYQSYIKVLRYVDHLLGVFIKELKKKRLYEDSIIIIISDHGMSYTGSNYNISDQVASIPFFIKAPGLARGLNARDVQIIDITPTILDIYRLPLSENYDGQSLFRHYNKRDKVIYALGKGGSWILKENGEWQHK